MKTSNVHYKNQTKHHQKILVDPNINENFCKKNFRVHSRYENVDIRHRMGSLSDLIILACEVR